MDANVRFLDGQYNAESTDGPLESAKISYPRGHWFNGPIEPPRWGKHPNTAVSETSVVTDLVTRAQHGDQHAWITLVERYAPLVWSICRRYRLSRADTDDVSQTVWLRLVGQLGQMRNPAALAGWIATTTGRECARINRAARPFQTARREADAGDPPDTAIESADSRLLAAERRAALRQAFTCLPPSYQQLLALLIEDPPVPYADVSARLGIPVGSIGPTRRRCLQKLRDHPAVTALIHAEPERTRTRQPEPGASAMAAAR